MKLSEVSGQDGKMCVQLINLLKVGKWELSGADITAHTETMKWVYSLANEMSEHLKGKGKETSPADGFKVKAMGPMAGSSSPSSSSATSGKSKKTKKK